MKVHSLKEKIIELRKLGQTFLEIQKQVNCSKGIISYHCKNAGLSIIPGITPQKLSASNIEKIKEYYQTHTLKETSDKFNVSHSTIKRYSDNKRIILNDDERKKNNYKRVCNHRQKIKKKSVDYKGGKCEICGYDKSIWSLHFHHINSAEKTFSISEYGNLAWKTIQKELDKCKIICANCHGELHEKEYKNKIVP